jgi:hypothetical protein
VNIGRNDPQPDQLRQVQDGAVAATMLPHVKAEVEAMERTVVTRTLQALGRNELSPEIALEAWREVAMARRLLKNFQTRITIGASVADELGPALNLGDSNG